jgi:hypothetical protein
MTPLILGQTTLQALKCLRSSGEKSFEKLTAILLSRLIGVPIRLCKSGYQAGVDALAEIPIAIEDKRYQGGTLNLNELQGKLTDTVRIYPDLQLWVLVTTVALDAFGERALKQTAEILGVGTLFLDSAAAEPELPDLTSIAALCANTPDEMLKAVSTPEWLDSERAAIRPPLTELEVELKKIRALPRFTQWLDRLCTKLTELPTWQLMTTRQNRRLTQVLEENAQTIFGTGFDSNKLVPRAAKVEINTWFTTAKETSTPEIGIIVGERYDGKTWLIFDWLKENLRTLQVPVFFIGSNHGMHSAKDLGDHILDDIKRVLGSFERHAEALIRRQRDFTAGSTPWCLIILDGLNEYGPNPQRWLEHLTWASGRIDLNARPCMVLASIRQGSWDDLASRVKNEVRAISVGPYNDTEFQAALKLRGLSNDYLQTVPENAQRMLRRPRYFDLVISHKDKLGRYDAITPDVLNWLDACDKIGRSKPATSGWDEEHFQGVLRGLAARHPFLRLQEVRSVIADFSPDIDTILHDLRSEGVLIKIGAGYKVSAERLALGMGLYLLEELCAAHEQGRELVECLRDELSPLQETDEMVARLRAATIAALLGDSSTPEQVIDTLVHAWLGSRNLSRADFQDVKAIRHLLLQPLIRLAPKIWSIERDDQRLQELARMTFVDALNTDRELIRNAVRWWFRLVPAAGATLFQRSHEAPEAAIHRRVAEPDLADLNLRICGDAGILMLHRVGLYLVSKVPDLVGADDLLALTATEEISGDYCGDGDRLAMRRALAHVSAAWCEGQAQRLSSDPDGRRRKILHWLIARAARADLHTLAEATKPPPDPQWELWRQGFRFDQARYEELRTRPFAPDENPVRFMELAREVVCDPGLPKPCQERVTVIRETVAELFRNTELLAGPFTSAEDFKFEQIVPVIAAWVPDLGASIVRHQIEGLPGRATDKQRWWNFRINQDAVLAHGTMRTALSALLTGPSSRNATNEERHALDRIFRALLPGMQPYERVDALIKRPFESLEWTDLYQLVADLMDGQWTNELLKSLRSETNLLRWRRLCYLLKEMENVHLTTADIALLLDPLLQGDNDDRFAALVAAVAGRVKSIPAEILLPLAADTTDQNSLIPRYAAWLLVHSEAFAHTTYEDLAAHLSPQWRAVAAAQWPDFARIFLEEVEQALYGAPVTNSRVETAEATLSAPVVVEAVGDNDPPTRFHLAPEVLSKMLDLRSPESTTGGISRADRDTLTELNEILAGSGAAVERFNRLRSQVAAELSRRAQEHRTCWSSSQFPQLLSDQLYEQSPSKFAAWIDALLADKLRAKHWWSGLSMAMFRTAIRKGNMRARDLWSLVCRFQREHFPSGISFPIHGIDWVFHELSCAEAEDELAIELLADLVCQAASDWELFQIALGARYQGQARLLKIVKNLLDHADPEVRARAVRIAGWLEGTSADIAGIEGSDSSLLVRRVATVALESERLEGWARHWFETFINGATPEARWGAGQLFLACVDRRCRFWTQPMLGQPGLSDRIRGEAILLLDAAKQPLDKKDRKLRETFLLHKVADLRAVCHPWHLEIEWEDIETAG